jgi:hypothetical protein
MRYYRFIFCFILLIGLVPIGVKAQLMLVEKSDGTREYFRVNEIQKISFSADNITIEDGIGMPAYGYDPPSYSLPGLRYLNFDVTNDFLSIPKSEVSGLNEKLSVFPNPASDILNIKSLLTNNRKSILDIISMQGKVVISETLIHDTNIHQVNISSLTNGLYICKLSDGKTLKSAIFIKQ